ncbi:MAG: sulfatase-like hydrolase/transferase [Chloroflexota bacterium]
MIMADDLGFETVNCYGGTSYKTPNIDALAKSGIRFTKGFSTPPAS